MRPVSSLSALQRALTSVPGGQALSTVSYVHGGGRIVVEADTTSGRRLMTASPVGGNRYAIRVENYPRISGRDDRINSVIEFTANSKWVENWKDQAHDRSLGGRR